MNNRVLHVPRGIDFLVVAGLCLLISGYRIGQGPLAGTEAHRTLAAHAMVTSGDWVLPKLYGQLYLKKPPLHYWILATAEKLAGRPGLDVWRWPSAIEAMLTALFLQAITWRWFGRLAGFVSGIAFCDMVCLWMQNRTAEVDALNTLFCVAAACCLVEMLTWKRGNPLSPFLLPLALAIAFAGVTMTKGPAGYTIIGGALIGVPLLNRAFAPLKQWRLWIALLLGLIPTMIWAIVAYHTIRRQGISPDWTGLQEPVAVQPLYQWLKLVLPAVALALTLPLYAFPATLALPLVLHPSVWRSRKPNDPDGFTDRQRQIVRGLVGTMAVAEILTFCSGLINARYSYVWLPLFCPLLGAAVAAWRAGVFPHWGAERIKLGLAIAAITQAVAAVAFTYMAIHRGSAVCGPLFSVCGICIFGSIIICRLIHQRRLTLAGIGILPLIALLVIPCGEYGVRDRFHRSHYLTGQILAAHVRPGTVVLTQNTLWDQPETFYYAGVGVQALPAFERAEPQPIAAMVQGRWLVVNASELAHWRERTDISLGEIIKLHDDPLIVLTQIQPRK